MKQITQERLIRAIDKLEDTLNNSPEMIRYDSIIGTLAARGIQHVYEEKPTGVDTARTAIEMIYWEAPRTKEELVILVLKWKAKIKHYHHKRQQVWNIQEKYNVSGLTWVPADFDPSFSYPWVHEDLKLLQSDLAILSEWKSKVVNKWIDYAMLDYCSIRRYKNDGLYRSSFSELLVATSFYQWAYTWKIEGESLNIILGNGLDTDPDSIASETICFCAM